MMFQVEGTMKMGNEMRKFNKLIKAKSANDATDQALSKLGSANGIPRSAIKIGKVTKVEG